MRKINRLGKSPDYKKFFFILLIFLISTAGCTTSSETRTQVFEVKPDYFTELRRQVTIGSPGTLLDTITTLRSSSVLFTQPEGAALLYIAEELVKSVYPDIDIPEGITPYFPENDIYIEIFEQVRRGEYPQLLPENQTFLNSVIIQVTALFTDKTETLDTCRENLEQIFRYNKNSVLIRYLLGYIAQTTGDTDGAIDYYMQSLEPDGSCYPSKAALAGIYAERGLYEESIAQLNDLGDLVNTNLDLTILLAQDYFILGDYENAGQTVISGLREFPQDLYLSILRAKILKAQEKYAVCRLLLQSLAEEFPDNADAVYEYILLLKEQGEIARGLARAENAVERFPERIDLKLIYGELLVLSDQPEEAAIALEDSTFQQPGDEAARVDILMQGAILSENWERADQYFEELSLLRLEAVSEVALQEEVTATTTAAQSDTQSPEEAIVLVLSDSSDDPLGLVLKATLLIQQNNYEDAAVFISEILPDIDDPGVRSRLFYLESITAQTPEDRQFSLQQSLFENPENIESITALGILYAEQGDYLRAVRYMRQAHALDPINPEIRESLENYQLRI